MRICLLTLDFPPFRSSGLTVYAEKVAQGLAARGHFVTVVASSRPTDESVGATLLSDSIHIVRVPGGRLDWIGFGWQAARYLHSCGSDFDIIHFADIHFAYAYQGPFIATGHQSFRQRLVSSHGHPYHVNWRDYLFRLAYYNGARWILEQPTARRAGHIIMVSQTTQREFVEQYGVPPSCTTVVYTGIDVQRFAILPEPAQARQKLGLPANIPIILYVGFSNPRKGVEYLAQALGQMQSPAYLVMVGKWAKHYRERFLSVLDQARSQVCIAGYVSDADLLTYFAAADIFVLPTLLEGFGIPLVEAMAAGLPVITTTGGAASEIVGAAGVVVSPGDSAALAAALDRVLADPELAQRLRQAGRERAHRLFDERGFAAATEAVYYRALDAFRSEAG